MALLILGAAVDRATQSSTFGSEWSHGVRVSQLGAATMHAGGTAYGTFHAGPHGVLTCCTTVVAAAGVLSAAGSVTTAVIIPSTGAALSGTSAILDATASASVELVKVQFVLTGGTYTESAIGTATPTYYGYIYSWNTTGVPNGTYTLQSLVTDNDANTAYSAGITVTVDNTAPTTAVIIPSTGRPSAGLVPSSTPPPRRAWEWSRSSSS